MLARVGARRPQDGSDPGLSAATSSPRGRRPTARSSAPATRATPRRRSPASPPPRRSAPAASPRPPAAPSPRPRAPTDVPVIGLPAGLQPRAAVGYGFAVAAEVAALVGAARRDPDRDRRRGSAPRGGARRADRRAPPRSPTRLERHDPGDLRLRADRAGRRTAGSARSTRTRSSPRSRTSCPRSTTTRSSAGAAPGDGARTQRGLPRATRDQHPRVRRALRADGEAGRARGRGRRSRSRPRARRRTERAALGGRCSATWSRSALAARAASTPRRSR